MYKLITVDVDGTLVGENLVISPAIFKAVAEVKQRGIKFTLATGRALFSAMKFAIPLGIDTPMITFGGALVSHPQTKEVYYKLPLDYTLAKTAYQILKSMDLHVNIQKIDGVFTTQMDHEAGVYTALTSNPMHIIDDVESCLQKDPMKLLVVCSDPEKLLNAEKLLKAKMGNQVFIARSLSSFLEVLNLDATKGKALKFLGEMLDIKREEIMAVGDHYNDLDMLEYAGLGIAMEISPEEVQDMADFVSGDPNHDGMAEILQKFVLNNGKQ